MNNKSDISNNKENENDLTEGGKFLLRKVNNNEINNSDEKNNNNNSNDNIMLRYYISRIKN